MFAVALAAVSAIFSLAHAQEQTPPVTSLRVATKSIEPFVFLGDAGPSGFSIDLWDLIALDAGLEFEYVIVDTVQQQLEAVQSGAADVAIAAITITQEREEDADFSFSYFDSGLGILVRSGGGGSDVFSAIVATPFTGALLRLVALLAVIIIISGHIIWFAERWRNSDFPRAYLPGVWEGIWWSAVTVTTVGYGDRTPRSSFGRIFGLFWMFAGLFIIANFTASVTTQLTVNEIQNAINGPQDLYGKPVATVEGSTAADWLARQNINHVGVEFAEDAYALLENGRVDAVVYDFPVLRYHALNDQSGIFEVVGAPFDKEDYGIAFAPASPLREETNRSLLRLRENGVYDRLYFEWFGENPDR